MDECINELKESFSMGGIKMRDTKEVIDCVEREAAPSS